MSYCRIVRENLVRFFGDRDNVSIPLQVSGRSFEASIIHDGDNDGLFVSNLGNSRYLPFEVFCVAVKLLLVKGGEAKKGNALNAKLGEPGLSLDSVEGCVAYEFYGKREGESVFRRISPINGLFLAAGICQKTRRGYMQLSEAFMNSLENHQDLNN